MYQTVKALVLRVREYDEHSALVKLLTVEHGLVVVKVRNLRRKNNPLSATCQLLVYGEFTLFEYRDKFTLNEAHPLEMFKNMRSDLVKLSLGTYLAQVAEYVAQESQADRELLPLLMNSLYALSTLGLPENQVKAVFELRCACVIGFQPELLGCSVCGNENPDRFDISSGALLCSGCASTPGRGIRMPVTAGVLHAMRYITTCPANKLFSFKLGEENMEALGKLTESFLVNQLEHGFSALDFYKSLFATYL